MDVSIIIIILFLWFTGSITKRYKKTETLKQKCRNIIHTSEKLEW